MRIGRLVTTVAAGAFLVAGGTAALVHASGVSRATLVSSSSGSGFDSPRDIAERGASPSPAATAPVPPVVLSPAPTTRPADDADNDGTEASEVDEAAEAAEPADANDPEEQSDSHHDDGSAQVQVQSNGGGDNSGSGDNGGHGGDNSNGN
jgi:hypothetical protein